MQVRRLLNAGLAALLGLWLVWSIWLTGIGFSADLLATWLAGVFHAQGAVGQIYPPETDLFTMYPPPEWIPYMAATGYDGPVFPYLYPPIWAVLTGWLVPWTDFEGFSSGARVLNHLMIVGMAWLGWRAARSRFDALPHVAAVCAACALTTFGAVALLQGQPQILVSFLIVLVVERDRAGADRTAGTVLALAAALKVYPALFALLWLVTRRWRALGWFLGVGAALAAASVLLAGWPLHLEFLRMLSVVAQTTMVNGLAFSIDPGAAQVLWPDALQPIAPPETMPDPGSTRRYWVMERPEGLTWGMRGLLLAGLAGLGLAMRRAPADTRAAALWPLAIAAAALLGPITWAYTYLPLMAFLPALRDALGRWPGWVAMLAVTVPVSLPVWPMYSVLPGLLYPQQLAGLAVAMLMAVLFALAALRGRGTAP